MLKHPEYIFGYFIQPKASPVIDSEIQFWLLFLILMLTILYLFRKEIKLHNLRKAGYHFQLIIANIWLLKTIYQFKRSYKKQRVIIDKVKQVIAVIESELKGAGNISDATDKLAKANIAYMQDQESFHLMLAYQIQMKIIELEKRRREIFLLHTIINSMVQEPNAGEYFTKPAERFKVLISAAAKSTVLQWQKKLQTASKKNDMEAAFKTLQTSEFSI